VRNEPDGSVAAHLEGPDAAVDELTEWLRAGPAMARVERVETRDAEATGATSFEVRY
jgi:acylphosphatase